MLTLQKLIDSEIPAGDYAWAMQDIRNSAEFLADKGIENFDAEDKKIARSYCMAFELMQYATAMKMKVGEPDAQNESDHQDGRSG